MRAPVLRSTTAAARAAFAEPRVTFAERRFPEDGFDECVVASDDHLLELHFVQYLRRMGVESPSGEIVVQPHCFGNKISIWTVTEMWVWRAAACRRGLVVLWGRG